MDWNDVTRWLWWLAIAAAFLWLMRKGGCGMHAGHSGHGGHEHAPTEGGSGSTRDPVCGMELRPEHAAAMRTVGERNVFLCSAACAEAFDREPARYAG